MLFVKIVTGCENSFDNQSDERRLRHLSAANTAPTDSLKKDLDEVAKMFRVAAPLRATPATEKKEPTVLKKVDSEEKDDKVSAHFDKNLELEWPTRILDKRSAYQAEDGGLPLDP